MYCYINLEIEGTAKIQLQYHEQKKSEFPKKKVNTNIVFLYICRLRSSEKRTNFLILVFVYYLTRRKLYIISFKTLTHRKANPDLVECHLPMGWKMFGFSNKDLDGIDNSNKPRLIIILKLIQLQVGLLSKLHLPLPF